MESMNLNTLASSLPTAQQNAEKELLNDFKAAALSITKLYRSSRKTSKRAYNAGYGAACQDLLNFVQQGLSTGGLGSTEGALDGGALTIGRVMDWTEARLEAIRATEEEEDEDEEREKDRVKAKSSLPSAVVRQTVSPPPVAARGSNAQASASAPATAAASPKIAAKRSVPRHKDTTSSSTTNPSISLETATTHSSPSTSPTTTTQGPTVTVPVTKPLRPRTAPPQPNVQTSSVLPEPFPAATTHTHSHTPETPFVISAGAKRRHAVMMMLDSSSSPISIATSGPSSVVSSPCGVTTMAGVGATSGIGRRRTRSTRNLNGQSQNQNIFVNQVASEAMDVEEEGRERKRVARR